MLVLHMAFRVLIVLLAGTGLIFWRAAFKVIMVVVAVLVALLIAAGAVGFFEGVHHVIK